MNAGTWFMNTSFGTSTIHGFQNFFGYWLDSIQFNWNCLVFFHFPPMIKGRRNLRLCNQTISPHKWLISCTRSMQLVAVETWRNIFLLLNFLVCQNKVYISGYCHKDQNWKTINALSPRLASTSVLANLRLYHLLLRVILRGFTFH